MEAAPDMHRTGREYRGLPQKCANSGPLESFTVEAARHSNTGNRGELVPKMDLRDRRLEVTPTGSISLQVFLLTRPPAVEGQRVFVGMSTAQLRVTRSFDEVDAELIASINKFNNHHAKFC